MGLGLCTTLYFFVNVAYACAIPKEELQATIDVAGLFARKVFGTWAERAICACVALSAAGNVITITYTAARILREIAKERILPAVVLSNRPCGSPLAALVVHWIPAALTIALLPAGKTAYSLILDTEGYTLQIFYLLITIGLFQARKKGWPGAALSATKFRCPTIFACIFAGISVVTVLVPWIPPSHYDSPLPYMTAQLCGLASLALGAGESKREALL